MLETIHIYYFVSGLTAQYSGCPSEEAWEDIMEEDSGYDCHLLLFKKKHMVNTILWYSLPINNVMSIITRLKKLNNIPIGMIS